MAPRFVVMEGAEEPKVPIEFFIKAVLHQDLASEKFSGGGKMLFLLGLAVVVIPKKGDDVEVILFGHKDEARFLFGDMKRDLEKTPVRVR